MKALNLHSGRTTWIGIFFWSAAMWAVLQIYLVIAGMYAFCGTGRSMCGCFKVLCGCMAVMIGRPSGKTECTLDQFESLSSKVKQRLQLR